MYLMGGDDDRKSGVTAISAMINGAVMTQGLKMLIGRERPGESGDELRLGGPRHDAYDSSFPSGHTSLAFAVATVMANHEPKRKWLYYGLATAVGVSRIRKSAHFPSDVLVGAGVGIYAGRSALDSGGRPLHFKF
jgi:undecaprenyl-diphosphatase